MVTTVGGVQIEIRGDNTPFNRSMREVETRAGRTSRSVVTDFNRMDGAATKLNTTLRGTATSMLALGAAVGVGAGLGGGVKIIADFSQAMSTLQAITQGTAEEMVALRAVANELGATTRFSATQAADAMTELARAGFTVNQVLAGIGPTLSAAQAGGAGIAETAAIIAATIGGFGLQATDAARIADVLAQAANGSAAGILDLGEALKFAAPTAKQLGLDLEETVAIIGKLSDGGITGGLAGRGFQSLATQLVNEKDKITDLIGAYDLAEEGLGSVLARLRNAGITTAQIIEIFRAENLDTFGILSDAALNGNLEKLNGLLNDAAGSSARAAKIMDDNLNGAILNASSAFEGLVLALADAGVEDALRSSVEGLSALLNLAADNADILAVAVVALSARAIIPLVASAVPAAIGALRNLGAALVATQGAAAKASVGLSLLGGPLTLGIAALAAGYIAYSRSVVTAEEAQSNFNKALDGLDKVNADLIADYGALAKANETLAKAIESGGDAAEAAARKEVDAINLRIAKNLELSRVYETQLRASLEAARAAERTARNDVSQGVGIGRRFDYGTNPEARAELDTAVQQFLRLVGAAQASGRALSDSERKTLDAIIAYRDAADTAGSLAAQLQKLGGLGGDFRDLFDPPAGGGKPGGGGTTTTTSTGGGGGSDDLQAQAAARLELERAFEIELAQAANDDERLRFLEDQEEVLRRTTDYAATGLGLAEAEALARAEVAALRTTEADAAERAAAADAAIARGVEANRVSEEVRARAAADAEALKDRIAGSISRGLEEGIRSGDWSDAFQGILADTTSSALSRAIDDLADELVNLFSGLFDGIGSSIGSGLGSLFGGGRAAGGPVKAGMRYMVGENGPEMFVPTVSGMVLPKTEFPASAAASGVTGAHVINVAPQWHVHGSITEEVLPRVQQMFAAQARELPRIIDSRVKDSTRRGRY